MSSSCECLEDMVRVELAFWCLALAIAGSSYGDEKTLADLIFPKGAVFTISVSLASYLPQDVAKGMAQVLEMDFIYPVVDKTAKKQPPKTIWRNPFPGAYIHTLELEKFRRDQFIKGRQRRNLRLQLEAAVTRLGYRGEECVLRFQCELNAIRKPESAMEDLLLILFKKSNLNCADSEKLCPFSLLQIMLHSRRLDEGV